MNNSMTTITAQMYEQAVSQVMTTREAVDMLRDCTKLRKFSDKLYIFAGDRDLRKVLTEGLLANHPDAKREAADRKVRNWLADRQSSIAKEDAIELCFILDLTVEESDRFLAMVSEEGFHYRNPEELIYIFARKHKMDYPAAVALRDRILPKLSEEPENTAETAFTDLIRQEFSQIQTEAELEEYLIDAQAKLGSKHNTAYRLFCEMLEKLEKPPLTDLYEDFEETDGKFTASRVLREYLHVQDLPEITDKSRLNALSALQRSVALNWPSESTLSRMKKRRVDVNRKVLILLFLATYDMDDAEDADWELEEEPDADAVFREFYQKMNTMLAYCGFCPLDPRSAFDWMAIYCMCGEDIYMLDSTLSEFLNMLFQTQPEEEDA